MNQQDRHTETSVQTEDAESASGSHVSLENVHGSITVPHHLAGFWKQWRAFVGPAILVSVGYMDPGNWGTDLQGGAQFKYGLLWVVGLASEGATEGARDVAAGFMGSGGHLGRHPQLRGG